MHDRAMVLLSGGIDSAVCLWWAVNQGFITHTLSFDYHLRNPRERDAATTLSKAAGTKSHEIIDLPFLKELVDNPASPESVLAKRFDNIPPAYIPSRNAIFYSLAASRAQILDTKWIVGGHHREDHQRFPDSTNTFFDLFNELLRIGTWGGTDTSPKVRTPLSKLNKREVIQLGRTLGVPFQLTWSCYGKDEIACGTCPACISRVEAFSAEDMIDPISYVGKRKS